MKSITLYGRVFITATVEAVTGLHIGGSDPGLEIGGLDNTVIRNPITQEPYIPGSSLKGKMRSQTEKVLGREQNQRIGQVRIHTCQRPEEYAADGGCPVCHVFGLPGNMDFSEPTRLLVRDVPLDLSSARGKAVWENVPAEGLPYGEFKTEVAIDRVTSQASPRTVERVPAGALFGPAELVFGIYEAADYARLKVALEALQLVEDDYLGGYGSRGSGKVRFQEVKLSARSSSDYAQEHDLGSFASVQKALEGFDGLQARLKQAIRANGGADGG